MAAAINDDSGSIEVYDDETGALLALDETRVKSAQLSPLKVGINLAKCAVGAGTFGVPAAFRAGGLWATAVGTVALGALAAYTFCTLADAEKRHARKNSGRRLTYPELTFGHVNLAEVYMYIFVLLTCFGVSAAYVVFIATTAPEFISGARPYEIILALLPLGAPLVLAGNFRFLAYTSIVGDVAVVAGVVAAITYGAEHNRLQPETLPAIRAGGLGTAMGNIAFLFLSHGVCLPMAQSLKGDLAHPGRFHAVVWGAFALIIAANLLFGVVCYSLFAERTADNIVKNLGRGPVLQAVRVFLCLDLFFTIPLQMAVAREIIEASVFHRLRWALAHRQAVAYGIRLCMLVVLLGASYAAVASSATNAFGNVVTLVGGIGGFGMGFVMPPLLHAAHLLQGRGARRAGAWLWASVAGQAVLVLLGLAGMVSTVYSIAAG